jgi:hypothetical protein
MCKHGIVLATNNVLGNGSRNNISDIVFLKPETFDSKHTRKIASELSKINQSLVNTNRPYMLIGFGRWGSQDPWLGVPVKWSQICGAKVIVEATLPQMNPELSQGSHFFHNLISSYVLYLSVPQGGKYKIDWNWLNKQETILETKYIKHIWTACALTILADGTHGRGIVKYHERN